eukprot:403360968
MLLQQQNIMQDPNNMILSQNCQNLPLQQMACVGTNGFQSTNTLQQKSNQIIQQNQQQHQQQNQAQQQIGNEQKMQQQQQQDQQQQQIAAAIDAAQLQQQIMNQTAAALQLQQLQQQQQQQPLLNLGVNANTSSSISQLMGASLNSNLHLGSHMNYNQPIQQQQQQQDPQISIYRGLYFSARPLSLKQISQQNMLQNPLNSKKCLACKELNTAKTLLCCDLCLIQVHYECYGSSTFLKHQYAGKALANLQQNNGSNAQNIPGITIQEPWICDRCEVAVESAIGTPLKDLANMFCYKCKGINGLMKQVMQSGQLENEDGEVEEGAQQQQQQCWVHYDCIMMQNNDDYILQNMQNHIVSKRNRLLELNVANQ